MTENTCGATKRDGSGDECGLPAGWGTDHVGEGPCKLHGGAADNRGKKNGNYKHGAFSKYIRDDLTESEETALDEMTEAFDDPETALEVIREQAAEAWLKYKRSGDHRFLREYRQLASEFNLAPNEDQLEVSGEGGAPMQVTINRERADESE